MDQIFQSISLIGQSFVKEPAVWWFLGPIFLLWLGMEIYFGQYKRERLGWNSILANGLSFTWINIAAFRVLFMEDLNSIDFWPRFIIISLFFVYGLITIYSAFFHRISANAAGFMAGPTQIYFLSMVSVLWGQGILVINKWVFFDLIIAYLIISTFFRLIRRKLGTLGEVEAIKKCERPE